MPKTYTRLAEDERYHIYEGLVHGLSHRVIAQQLGRSHSTISREVSRNKGLRGYRPKQAQRLTMQRQRNKPKHIKLNPQMQAIIAQRITKDWSPEQVQGRLRSEGFPMVCLPPFTDLSSKTKPLEAFYTSTFATASPTKQEQEKPKREGKS